MSITKMTPRPRFPLRAAALALGVACLALPGAGADAAAPAVLATTKPLHSLTAMVMRGVGEPGLLIKGATSPHTFSLKPSDRRAIGDAALVVWTGPGVERVLEKTLHPLEEAGRALEVAELPGLTLRPAREGGAWEAHLHDHDGHDHGADDHEAHDHDPHHEDGDAHDEGDDHDHDRDASVDPHLWLDPNNAATVVKAVAERLSVIDPAHADRYRANAAEAMGALASLTGELATTLAPVTKRPFIVFHDAYQYAENRFGLNAVGSITVDPDREPSAKRLSELRRKIVDGGVVCVFAEPQFEPKLARTVLEGTAAKLGTLDPVGADLPEGPDLYPTLMRRLAASLVACLSP